MKGVKQGMLVVIDIMFIMLAYLLALGFQEEQLTKGFVEENLYRFVLIIGVYIACFFIFKLYESLWSYASIDEFLLATCGGLVAALVNCMYTAVTDFIDLKVNILAAILTIVFVLGFRVVFRAYRRGLIIVSKLSKKNCKRVMIVGAGSAGTMILKEMINSEFSEYNPVAIIDDNHNKWGRQIYGVKVYGGKYDIKRVAEEKNIEVIVIAMPAVDNEVRANIIDICRNTKCKVKIIPGLYEILNGTVNVSHIRDVDVEDLLGREQVKLDNHEIKEYIENKKVMVTGGGGSIGSELCRQIARFKPKELLIIDIYENNAYDIQNELRRKWPDLNLKVLIATVRERTRLDKIFEEYKPNVVFHAAAHKHVPLMEDSPGEAIKNNVFGTLNVTQLADKHGVEKFVLISTDKAVNPTNVMGATKRLCEMIVQAMDKISNTTFVAVRFGNVLGSNGSVIPLFKKQIADGGPVTVTHKEITRYFMLIPEAAQLVLQAGAYANGGEIFVLDMGKPVKIYDLACDLIKLSGYEPNRDIKVEVTGLRPGEKLYEELLMSEEGLKETRHEKIFIGKPGHADIEGIKKELENIRYVVENGTREQLIEKLMEVVPTFKRPEYKEENANAIGS